MYIIFYYTFYTPTGEHSQLQNVRQLDDSYLFSFLFLSDCRKRYQFSTVPTIPMETFLTLSVSNFWYIIYNCITMIAVVVTDIPKCRNTLWLVLVFLIIRTHSNTIKSNAISTSVRESQNIVVSVFTKITSQKCTICNQPMLL